MEHHSRNSKLALIDLLNSSSDEDEKLIRLTIELSAVSVEPNVPCRLEISHLNASTAQFVVVPEATVAVRILRKMLLWTYKSMKEGTRQ
jgi:hypothetical protein